MAFFAPPPSGMKVLLVDQWIETGGTMRAAIQLVEKLGATVAGAFGCLHDPPSPSNQSTVPLFAENQHAGLSTAGIAAVAIENTEGGKWIKDNYKFSHCIPEELQSQIDHKHLDSFESFKNGA